MDAALQSSGRPLDPASRARFEPRFGRDFSRVRVHDDASAAASARAVHAHAYTVGDDMVFAGGRYAPHTREGQRLLAHELTHVVQQEFGKHGGSGTPTLGGEHEKEADSMAGDFLAGGSTALTPRASTGIVVARQPDDAPKIDRQVELPPHVVPMDAAAIPECEAGARWSPDLRKCVKFKWALSQSNTNGSSSTDDYQSAVSVKFTPDAGLTKCDNISFVQSVRYFETATGTSKEPRENFKNRMAGGGWTIDRLDQRKYGWYGYNNDGKPSGTVKPGKATTPAELSDTPHWNVPNLTWDFETCAICKKGTDSNHVYGCLTWGFDVDGSNKLTSHTSRELASPSAEFADAIKQWNVQAAGPEAKRNEATQEPLGPLK